MAHHVLLGKLPTFSLLSNIKGNSRSLPSGSVLPKEPFEHSSHVSHPTMSLCFQRDHSPTTAHRAVIPCCPCCVHWFTGTSFSHPVLLTSQKRYESFRTICSLSISLFVWTHLGRSPLCPYLLFSCLSRPSNPTTFPCQSFLILL